MSQPAPIGVYVHWPYCARICPYCDFNVVRARGREAEAEALAAALLTDLQTQAARIGPRRLASIHFGGGTPSLMPPVWIERLIAAATALFPPTDDLEVGLEANPMDAAALTDIRSAGVERLSLGVQGLDDAALRDLGRDHDAGQAARALDAALALFPRVSLDAIYGREGQTPESWRAELGALARSGVGHLSAYQLTYEPETAFGRAAAAGRRRPPDEDASAAFWDATADVLTAAGFTAYEVSNWARSPDQQSRHNLLYWRGVEYLGVGPGAHGRVAINGVRRATAGARRPRDFIDGVASAGHGLAEDTALSRLEVAEERVILGLRIDEGVPYADLPGLAADHPEVIDLVNLGLLAPPPTA